MGSKRFLLHCNNLGGSFLESSLVRAFHCDHHLLPLPPGHRFPIGKYRLLREAVEATLADVRVSEAMPATDGELALAHEPD